MKFTHHSVDHVGSRECYFCSTPLAGSPSKVLESWQDGIDICCCNKCFRSMRDGEPVTVSFTVELAGVLTPKSGYR